MSENQPVEYKTVYFSGEIFDNYNQDVAIQQALGSNRIPQKLEAGDFQSANFVTGVSGWRLRWDGTFEGNSGVFRGSVSVASLDIPDTVTANSFHVDTQGNAWWGATTLGSAVAKVLKTGVATFTDITATGTINAIGGYIGSGTALVFESQGINVGTTGYIRGGQTDFNSGQGFFLGYSGGQYKFSIGNPDGTDSAGGKTITVAGNAQVSTSSPKIGTGAILFDGSGDYLTLADSTDWAFGTADFTLDFWVKFTSTNQLYISQFVDNDNRVNFWFESGTLGFRARSGASELAFYTVSWAPSTGVWYHLEFSRNGSTFRIFIDGVSQSLTTGTAIGTNSLPDLAAVFGIGQQGTSDRVFDGRIDELRLSKGIARHTANFTPSTTAYSTDSYTVLLIHGDGTNGSTTIEDWSITLNTPGDFMNWDGEDLTISLQNALSFTASNNLKWSNDSSATVTNGGTPNVYIKYKETLINENLGTIRVKWDINFTNSNGRARLFKNGVAVGTERVADGASHTYSDDINGVVNGDLIQVYSWNAGGTDYTISNFRLYFDVAISQLYKKTLTTPLPITFAFTTDPTNNL